MATKVLASYPLWKRFPPPSRLHLAVGLVPDVPTKKHTPVQYIYETQCHMLVRQMIDLLEKPFNWPGIRESVVERAAEWFFDIASEDQASWSIKAVWQRDPRYLAPFYLLALTDLLSAVKQWLAEYDKWQKSKRLSRQSSSAKTPSA